jgi:hypothetical protein
MMALVARPTHSLATNEGVCRLGQNGIKFANRSRCPANSRCTGPEQSSVARISLQLGTENR